MDSRRSLLVIALLFISFLVYQQWQLDYHTPKPVATEQVKVSSDVPASSASSSSDIATTAQAQGRIITLENDVFRLEVDTLGGDVVHSELLKYDAELNSNTPVYVVNQQSKSCLYRTKWSCW